MFVREIANLNGIFYVEPDDFTRLGDQIAD